MCNNPPYFGMSRSQRLLDLVTLLGGRRARSLQEIVDRFEISERTAYRDLATLDDSRIPIVRDEHGYRLLEGSTLRPLNLSGEERAVLRLALSNPALRRNRSVARRISGLEAKLDAASSASEESPSGLALAGIERTGGLVDGLMDALERAAAAHRSVDIRYVSLSSRKMRWRGVDPYSVFHRADAWYLVGRCRLHDEARIFRLDRIRELREASSFFEVPADFDLADYLHDSWSIYLGRRRHDVTLRFDRALAPLVVHARHHPNESIQHLPDGGVEYRVQLSHLEEIARWVVGFGGKVKVVAPKELAARVRKIALGAAEE